MQKHYLALRNKATLHFEDKKEQSLSSNFRQRSNLRLV